MQSSIIHQVRLIGTFSFQPLNWSKKLETWLPNIPYAPSRRGDDMLCCRKACMSYAQWVFCLLSDMPKVRHLTDPPNLFGDEQ